MEITMGMDYWLSLLTSVVLPVLVGLVTTRMTSGGLKATLLLALSAVNGFVLEFANASEGYVLGDAVIGTLVSFGISVMMHFGLYKPSGLAAKAQMTFVRNKDGVFAQQE